MKRNKGEIWAAYCLKRYKCGPLIDDLNIHDGLVIAYGIGYADGLRDSHHEVRK